MDYLSDEGRQITDLLIDKFKPLLDENSVEPAEFRALALTE